MIIFLKEIDRAKICSFLSNKVEEVFTPSVTYAFLIEGSNGSRISIPSSVDDVYMCNGILCRSILDVVNELKN